MPHFKLFSSCVCTHFCKWGASRAGEEQRLNLIEELATFERKFGHWGTREYAKHGERIRAASAAIGLIEAVLRDEEMTIKTRLDMIAFELGYRMKTGRFED